MAGWADRRNRGERDLGGKGPCMNMYGHVCVRFGCTSWVILCAGSANSPVGERKERRGLLRWGPPPSLFSLRDLSEREMGTPKSLSLSPPASPCRDKINTRNKMDEIMDEKSPSRSPSPEVDRSRSRSRERSPEDRPQEDVRDGDPREDKDDVEEPRSEDHKAFVGGVPRDFDDVGLKDIFKDFDPIDAYLQRERNSGRSRGFGFVRFPSAEALQEAIDKLHDTEVVDGRRISVTKAIPQSMTSPGTPADAIRRGDYHARGRQRDYGGRPRGGGGGGGRYDDRDNGYRSRNSSGYGRYRPGYGYDGPPSSRYEPYDHYSKYDRSDRRGGGGGGYRGYESDRYGGGSRGSNYDRGYRRDTYSRPDAGYSYEDRRGGGGGGPSRGYFDAARGVYVSPGSGPSHDDRYRGGDRYDGDRYGGGSRYGGGDRYGSDRYDSYRGGGSSYDRR